MYFNHERIMNISPINKCYWRLYLDLENAFNFGTRMTVKEFKEYIKNNDVSDDAYIRLYKNGYVNI
jgi:hypothetical protein